MDQEMLEELPSFDKLLLDTQEPGTMGGRQEGKRDLEPWEGFPLSPQSCHPEPIPAATHESFSPEHPPAAAWGQTPTLSPLPSSRRHSMDLSEKLRAWSC